MNKYLDFEGLRFFLSKLTSLFLGKTEISEFYSVTDQFLDIDPSVIAFDTKESYVNHISLNN